MVYKVDRLTRSLADFAKMVEVFDAHGVSFVSVTQQFNTTTSMGRLTLNVLLSFAQFEREVTGERIRDKIAASKRKGMWMGGVPPVGYLPHERTLVIDEPQAERIREIYRIYLRLGCVRQLKAEVDRLGWITPIRKSRRENDMGGHPFSRGHLYRILGNPVYIGKIVHKGEVFEGQHPAIVDAGLWQAVQDRIRTNLQGHRMRAMAINPSLLTGLVFDDQGNRLTPTHSKKGARRYRYYVSHPLLMEGREADPTAVRWPAQELEDGMINAITGFLKDESRLLQLMENLQAKEVRNQLQFTAGLARQLTEGKPEQRIVILQRIVSRVTIHENKFEIVMNTAAVFATQGDQATDEDTTVIEVPMQLKRRGHTMRLIVQPRTGEATLGSIPHLVSPDRQSACVDCTTTSSGRSNSIRTIELEEKVSSTHMARVLYLAFLAPDIVERIIHGKLPIDFDTTRLMRLTPLPLDWGEQRMLLGLNQ